MCGEPILLVLLAAMGTASWMLLCVSLAIFGRALYKAFLRRKAMRHTALSGPEANT